MRITDILRINKVSNVILDFDHTVTTFESKTSIGVFSNLLCEKYKNKKKIIDCLAIKTNNTFLLMILWFLKLKLLNKYLTKESLILAVKEFNIRKDFIELYNYCMEKNICITICSSGYKPLIEEILNCYNIKDCIVLANDKANFKTIISPKNKSRFLSRKSKFDLLLGDNTNDLLMVKDYNIITIGYCNYKDDINFYRKEFDYVIFNNKFM